MKTSGNLRSSVGIVPRAVAIAVVATLSLTLAGCAATEVDEKRTREAILYDVEQKTGVRVDWVKCPSGVEVVPGARFECRVRARDGRLAVAKMEVLNLDADVRFLSLRPVGG